MHIFIMIIPCAVILQFSPMCAASPYDILTYNSSLVAMEYASLNVTPVTPSSILISGLATADDYMALLSLIFYNNTFPNPERATATINFTVSDNLMMNYEYDSAITLVHIIPTINYAFLVFNASQNVTYTKAFPPSPVPLFMGLSNITDPDPAALLQWITITISNPSTSDVLIVTATLPGLMVAMTTNTSLNISGPANLTTYIKALQNVKYSNSYVALQSGQRTINVVTFDGTMQSPQQNVTISVNAPPICYFDNMVCA